MTNVSTVAQYAFILLGLHPATISARLLDIARAAEKKLLQNAICGCCRHGGATRYYRSAFLPGFCTFAAGINRNGVSSPRPAWPFFSGPDDMSEGFFGVAIDEKAPPTLSLRGGQKPSNTDGAKA